MPILSFQACRAEDPHLADWEQEELFWGTYYSTPPEIQNKHKEAQQWSCTWLWPLTPSVLASPEASRGKQGEEAAQWYPRYLQGNQL